LDYAGLTAGDIDHVAYSFDPQLRRTRFRPEWWADPRFEEVFLLRLGQVRGVAEELLGRPLRQRFHFVPHHLAHAASAYFPSGFDRAAILTIDGIVEAAGSSLARAVGTRMQPVETFDYPHSIGSVWEIICGYLGFSTYDASKVMGLAAYGNPEAFRHQFQSIMHVGKEDYAVDPEAIGFQSAKVSRIETLLGPPRDPGMEILPRHADIAAELQEATNPAIGRFLRCVHTFRAARCRHRGRRRLCRALRQAEKPSRARQLHAVSRSRVQPARNSGGGQVGRSHAPAQQIPGA
jgi:carbamoyltransferase